MSSTMVGSALAIALGVILGSTLGRMVGLNKLIPYGG